VAYFQIESGTITLACDNLSAIRMTSYDALGTNPSSCAHYDLVMAIQYTKSASLQWIHQHVKGHQDDHTNLVLTPTKLINVEMDFKAKKYWAETHMVSEESRIHSFLGQPWSISVGGHKIVSNLAEKFSRLVPEAKNSGILGQERAIPTGPIQCD
jgi:hypothetical protein